MNVLVAKLIFFLKIIHELDSRNVIANTEHRKVFKAIFFFYVQYIPLFLFLMLNWSTEGKPTICMATDDAVTGLFVQDLY